MLLMSASKPYSSVLNLMILFPLDGLKTGAKINKVITHESPMDCLSCLPS